MKIAVTIGELKTELAAIERKMQLSIAPADSPSLSNSDGRGDEKKYIINEAASVKGRKI